MLKATRLRLYPTPEQEAHLAAQFGAVRWVWNKALWAKRHAWRTHGLDLSVIHDLKPLLARAKRQERRTWLREVDSMALQQALIHLDRAFRAFFEGRAGFPRFKSRRGEQASYHCTGKVGVVEGGVTIPKMGAPVRAVVHRPIEGRVRSITLTRSAAGRYHACVLHDTDEIEPEPPATVLADEIHAFDLGLEHVVVTNRGMKIENPRHLRAAQRAIRRRQKDLARKRKGSKNREKARIKLARALERLGNIRADFQHKLSRRIVNESQGAIAAERLNVRGMMKNHALARAISDVGWSGLVAKVAYKARRAGKLFVQVDRFEPSTKRCSGCGEVGASLNLGVRAWTCPACGASHDRDINAAINIAAAGARQLLAGGTLVIASGGPRQTTPAVAAAGEGRSLAA